MSDIAAAYVRQLRPSPERPLTRLDKFVLLLLADYHNPETNTAAVSIARLSTEALTTEWWTWVVIRGLIERGVLATRKTMSARARVMNAYEFVELRTNTPSIKRASKKACIHDLEACDDCLKRGGMLLVSR